MCDRNVIDSELRLLAAVRRSVREHGGEPSIVRSTNFSMSAPKRTAGRRVERGARAVNGLSRSRKNALTCIANLQWTA